MLCADCKKREAVVFLNRVENNQYKIIGLCKECAEKRGLKPESINPYNLPLDDMDEDAVKNINEQMGNIFKNIDMNSFNKMLSEMDPEELKNMMTMSQIPAELNLDGLDDEGEVVSNGGVTDAINSLIKSMASTNGETDESEYIEYDPSDFKSSDEINKKRSKTKLKDVEKKKKRKFLDTYGTNLTDEAKNNEIDRIVGRDKEIDRVVQILNRRAKNNPVLIGEPGVGKTAIAEGLAVRIVEKNVPVKMYDTEIYELNLTNLVAGTQFRGQFESRMKGIINEARSEGNIILVIDELHNIVGAGEADSGAMNAANILKPALAKGLVQIIGATTLSEYRKHIEKDTALERRFQPVIVDEPSIEDTIEILKGIKDYYEDYHKVKINDKIIETAVRMSERYITDRFLPDKAIDVIDEAGSRANLKNVGLVELEECKQELKKVIDDREALAKNENYEKAAEMKSRELILNGKINKLKEACENIYLTEDDVAYVIEAWTKIPVQKISSEEANTLINLEDKLHKRIVGQNDAVISVAKAMRRSRSGFKKKKKPASFIFVGPTGVGKTELARTLASEMFGSEDAMVRIDMSEYMEKHTVSKLIGAPPGYVGYDEAGYLTEKIRRKPYSVVLFDEIEKAHVDIFNILLQILEDGRLTDSQGRTVNFENTVLIMTSNLGNSNAGINLIGFDSFAEKKSEDLNRKNKIQDALKTTFKPEFLNRIDEIIQFESLDKKELRQIVDLMAEEIKEESEEKDIELHIDDEVKDLIVEKGYDPKFGARPLRRTLQKFVEDELSESYLKGEIVSGDIVNVKVIDGKTVVEKQ